MGYVGANLTKHTCNCIIHEASGYSPHELLFGQSPRTPTSLPNKNQYTTYGEYMTELIENLGLATNYRTSKYGTGKI
jgi:hypothetical protein